ncbi:MAG: c-type cytochrome [Candidatus Polarisedimenticolia bacterium]
MSRPVRWLALMAILVITQGCVRGCTSRQPPIHVNPNMDDQPRYEAQASSEFFADGKSMRTPVEGTVPRSSRPEPLRTDTRYLSGKEADGKLVATSPVPADDAVMARGEERYGIYCAPCHHRQGDGKGVLFTRGNIPTTSLHLERVRVAPDGHLFDVITNGLGLMPGYRYPIPPEDRWAIVAYVRKLQAEHASEAP